MKKMLKIAAIGATVIAGASIASAADLEFNIYGASAQGTYWKQVAEDFLKTKYGCTAAQIDKQFRDPVSGAVKPESEAKAAIFIGFGCSGYTSGNVVIRYTEDKSSEGPRAVMGVDPDGLSSCDSAGHETERRQITYTGTSKATAAYAIGCHPVNIGASDVESKSFTQITPGFDFSNVYIPGKDVLAYKRPIVVPFSFFANTALPVDNLTRQQALMIFGQSTGLTNWDQFGPGYPSASIAVCMRHAGSGTHATLDKAIMRKDGINLINASNTNPDNGPLTFFNASTSNEVACVNNNAGLSTSTAIAIGYADSDKIVSALDSNGNEVNAAYPNVKRLKLNGAGEGMTQDNYDTYTYSALKNEIINGIYDFWSAQWIYRSKTADSNWVTHFNKLMTYAETKELDCDPSDSSKKFTGCYWVKSEDMMVVKEKDSDIATF